MRVSAAGNMPLQGLVKPPAKPVVMICFIRNYTKIICECETLKICKSQYKHSSILRFDIC